MSVLSADPSAWLAPVLRNLGVTWFEAYLSGSGDSGQLDEVNFKGEGDQELESEKIFAALERLPLHSQGGFVTNFREAFEGMIDTAVDHMGNYCDNEGGSIWASFGVEGDLINLIDGDYTPGSYEDDEDEPDEDEPDEGEDEPENDEEYLSI